MAARDYDDFDLLVETVGEGRYRARVLASPTDRTPAVEFALPFEPTILENLLLRLDPGRSGTRRAAANPQVQAARDFGGPLFEAVFAGPVGATWAASREAVGGAGRGLRLRLRLGEAPAIASLPWELLHDRSSNAFLAQSERTPLVRYLDVPGRLDPLPIDGPLSVLVVVAAPTDLPELDVEGEWQRVTEALEARTEAGLVRLARLAEPTIPALGRHLRRHAVHVLHFVGHGDYDDAIDDGVLYFCDAYGRSSAVTSSVLGPYVHDHDPLRLVVLNACRSASVDSQDPFGGMAQGLVQQNASAVVAMQFPITDRAAVTFTGELYGALADGLPVDQAMASTRKALAASFGAEWATPVLFLRADDAQLFTGVAPTPPGESVPPPPVAPPPPDAVSSPPAVGPEPEPEAESPGSPQRPGPPEPAPRDRDRRGRGAVAVGAGLVGVLVLAGALWTLGPDDDDPARTSHAGLAPAAAAGTPTPTPTELPAPTSPPAPTPTPAVAPVDRPALTAVRFSTPPSIDADPGEWDGAPEVAVDRVIAGSAGDVGFGARARLGWDADAWYVLAEVTDPTITQTHAGEPHRVYEGDSFGFEIGTDLVTTPVSRLRTEDSHVLIGPTPEEGVVVARNVPEGSAFERGSVIDAGSYAIRLTGDGYVVEAAVPWSLLGMDPPMPGTVLATNLAASDARPSGARTGDLRVMVSNNPARHNNNARYRHLWGTVELTG
jgi:hypothetical protein